ncbi:MAG: single-stranded DNA-binding protein [Bryobacterales bacterium]|nr:single-stranded DNA-binding protein [Bryobacterales bacterium]
MASSLNKVMLIGNLGRDAETRHTASGIPVTSFPLATTYRSKDPATGEFRERTDWHDVVLWRGDRVAPYLKKGKKVFVEGRLQTRSWDDPSGNKRYRTEVICDSFGLMLLGGPGDAGAASSGGSYRSSGSYGGGGGSGGGYNRPSPQPTAPRSDEPAGDSGGSGMQDDDDIPF